MATFACQPDVLTSQREFGFVVIEGYIIPIGWLMTGSAVSSKLAFMVVILFMAGIAIGRRAFVYVVDVTLFAFNFLMFAFEFEICKVVIELGGFPGSGGMAGCAVCAEATLMWFIFFMARITVLWKGLQIRDGTCIEMTFSADRISVFAG
jgi:hypothetical protein